MSRHPRAVTTWVATSLVSLFAASAMLVGAAGPSTASGDGGDQDALAWSIDGTIFSTTLETPLVPPIARFAPGHVERTKVWVRNDSDEAHDLSVALDVAKDAARADDLLAQRGLALSVQLNQDDWRTMRIGVEDRALVAGVLEPGESASLAVRVAMSPKSQITLLGSDLDVVVGFEESPTNAGSLIQRLLPSGSPVSSLLVPIGLLVVAAGSLLLNRVQSHRLDNPFPQAGGRQRERAITVEDVDFDLFSTSR